MDVLARAIIEAELKIPAEKLILDRVATRRQDAVAAGVGEFKTDDLTQVRAAVAPRAIAGGVTRPVIELGIVFDPPAGRIFCRCCDQRFRQKPRDYFLLRFAG